MPKRSHTRHVGRLWVMVAMVLSLSACTAEKGALKRLTFHQELP